MLKLITIFLFLKSLYEANMIDGIIENLINKQNIKLVSHYYVHKDLQYIAEKSGGYIGDSLGMAQWATKTECDTIVLAGVYFMAETIKILNPNKKVFVLDKEATCSLDVGCDYEGLKQMVENNQDREVVVYANTSAKVKTLANWVVTSKNAIPIVEHLYEQDKKILWAPDKHMARYIQNQTDADMISWQGTCSVHDQFKIDGINNLKENYPGAKVIAHPESPEEITSMADLVGSTKDMIQYTIENDSNTFIVATDKGLFYQLQKHSPNKIFLQAPTGGNGATCKMCAQCPWMEKNTVRQLYDFLSGVPFYEVNVDENIAAKAKLPLDKMISFKG